MEIDDGNNNNTILFSGCRSARFLSYCVIVLSVWVRMIVSGQSARCDSMQRNIGWGGGIVIEGESPMDDSFPV